MLVKHYLFPLTQGTRKICLFSQPLCGIALCVVETAIEKLNEKLTEKSFSRITILLEPVYKNQMENKMKMRQDSIYNSENKCK